MTSSRRQYAAIAALVLVLGGILTGLYLRTQQQESSLYYEKIAIVRQIKQVDARWELDVMRSRLGINENYDPLIAPLVELDRLHAGLLAMMSREPSAMTRAAMAVRDALHEKARLIERFKSHNAVLRNSLVFLPTAAEDLESSLGSYATRKSEAAENIQGASNTVLLDTMVYSQRPTVELSGLIKRQLESLAAMPLMNRTAVIDTFSIFRLHVLTVLREQSMVNQILNGIALIPTTRRIDAFDALLSAAQRQIDLRTDLDRQYLLIFAAALAAMFVHVAIRLLRSHALVNRVNRKLGDANSDLERRVEDRTSALSARNDELRESQTMLEIQALELATARDAAEANNRAKSAFLATMSHELRTPLNAIIGFAELMQVQLFGPVGHVKYGEYVDDIQKSGSHLLSLINDILDLSRLDAGKADLDERDFPVDELITDVCRSLHPLAQRGQLALIPELALALPLLHGDPRRIRQVILNLMSNAIKFTPETGTVTVRAAIVAAGLQIEVSDTGIGMNAEEIPKAMEQFGQVDSRLARKYEGTGLGLPLAKRLVELHEASFEIESVPDVGTTIRMVFPPQRLVADEREAVARAA